ncbi:MAG: 23S rRNA (pseudouridine(1915)-N(3))-methyltransferase RlmH [Saprospiraceae bacterium]|jgi:23S rRNA (pseudouridine1915-N3)-methyltransferase
MKIELWTIGKTAEAYLDKGIGIYEKRLKNYLPFQFEILPNSKLKTGEEHVVKQDEARLVLNKLQSTDFLVLLDERGKEFTSEGLAKWMETQLNAPHRRLIFLIGGAFGFHQDLYDRANAQWSLSKLTFSHQMIRLFALEQLYRAMTILKNEPYHNR